MSVSTHATTQHASPSALVLQRFAGAFAWMQGVLDSYFDIVACRDEVARLQLLSNEELARLGITRDGIVAHAYRRHLQK